MNTFAKLLIPTVSVLGVATLVGVAMSHSHRAHVNSTRQNALLVAEPVQVESGHNPGSRHTASLQLEPSTAHADLESPDTLEDLDQIRAWARRNPQLAQEWLAGASEGAKRDAVSETVCLKIAETNPAAAVALADGYGAGCTNVLENLMSQWADLDIQAAYRWATSKPPGAQRDGLLSRIAFVESKTDPQSAATLVAEQIASEQIQDEAAISVLYQWAQKDPNAAMSWAQSFSAGTLHDRAVNEVQNVMAINSQSTNAL